MNDNNLHGTAKQSWRAAHIDFSDDVDCTVHLVHFLDFFTKKHSKHWFQRNILHLTEEKAKELVSGRKGCYSDTNMQRLHAYQAFVTPTSKPQLPKELQSELDGPHWSPEV